MRLVEHPNVVDLKAYFYSNGDKVRQRHEEGGILLTGTLAERRSVSQLGTGIRPRDRVQGFKALFKIEATDAVAADQAVHVPGGQFSSFPNPIFQLSLFVLV